MSATVQEAEAKRVKLTEAVQPSKGVTSSAAAGPSFAFQPHQQRQQQQHHQPSQPATSHQPERSQQPLAAGSQSTMPLAAPSRPPVVVTLLPALTELWEASSLPGNRMRIDLHLLITSCQDIVNVEKFIEASCMSARCFILCELR